MFSEKRLAKTVRGVNNGLFMIMLVCGLAQRLLSWKATWAFPEKRGNRSF